MLMTVVDVVDVVVVVAVQTKGMVEELETRFGEELATTRPRTSQSRRGRRKVVGFEQL